MRPKILSLGAQDLDLPQTGEPLSASAPASPTPATEPATGDLREAVDDFQRRLITASLERHRHNWASAARELGLDRANLGRMARRLGLK